MAEADPKAAVTPVREIYDAHICECGEGPLWHPLRKQLYWVDVTTQDILTRENGQTVKIAFDEFVTSMAWIDAVHILVATETGLIVLNLETKTQTLLCALEAGRSETRSNDGRADPWGGFWISTMGKNAESGAGKLYRYHNSKLSIIVDAITIPNAICFDKGRLRAYFADTALSKLYVIALNSETGAPQGKPALFKDFEGAAIDGAVVDRDGNLWIGVWDGFEVLKVSPGGDIVDRLPAGAARPTCPAFGGPDYSDLYVTTAAIGLKETLQDIPEQGRTLVFKNAVQGAAEPRFILHENFELVR